MYTNVVTIREWDKPADMVDVMMPIVADVHVAIGFTSYLAEHMVEGFAVSLLVEGRAPIALRSGMKVDKAAYADLMDGTKGGGV